MGRRALVPVILAFAWAIDAPAPGALHAEAPKTAAPIQYRFTFPEPQHRWMQVEAEFDDLSQPTLELRMSRSSPGRYSLHDFAKNVYDVHTFGSDGREIETTRPDPYGWNVAGFGRSVRVRYKVYGDRVDGTYLAVDTTHAHINMPAAIMWAHGLELRPARLRFEEPKGMHWRVATQLHEDRPPNHGDRSPNDSRRPVPDNPDHPDNGTDARRPVPDNPESALEFTAPNLQYLMDSPVEFGPESIRTFTVGPRTFRFAAHHAGTDAELDSYVQDVEKIVRQEGAVYGEFPDYEPGDYTFLADYLPYANGDGMEHRNSTVMTAAGSIRDQRVQLLGTVAHEFFHCWNVERIRPRGIEPFDFDRANMTDSLWLAEGFTQYYGPLMLQRAKLVDLPHTLRTFAGLVASVALSPAHLVRSAADMSRMAPFIDGGRTVDRTNWTNTVTSYYPFGGAIALALDLTLRARSNGAVGLDDYMRAMWRVHGKPGGAREGYVDRPYTIEDAEARLAEVSADRAFARDFFARYVEGHDVADYARLLAPAGLVLRPHDAARAWLGDLRFETRSDVPRVSALVEPNWPVYQTGLDQDDEIRLLDGQRIATASDLENVLRRHKPGDRIDLVFVDRTGAAKTAGVTLAADPRLEIVAVESAGGTLTAAQRAFRDGWLAARGERQPALDGGFITSTPTRLPRRGPRPAAFVLHSNTPGIPGRRALSAGRLAHLGATPAFHHAPPGPK